jgi:outer membrane lipoprotein SlyB
MYRLLFALSVLAIMAAPIGGEAFAQSSAGRGAVVGGASGAIIGGVAGGGRGAGIGAVVGGGTGAVIGNERARRNTYRWRNGQCWVRTRNGRYHVVANRYCR